ncbi:MAG: zinc ribbon domain-containing protein [Gemmatimonadota bacterium]
MLLEAIAALIVGTAILVLVLEPLIRVEAMPVIVTDPEEAEESAKGQALTALKEIEFDRATGKLSDADYESLKRRYTNVALDALRAEERNAPAVVPALTGDLESQVAARVATLRGAASRVRSCPSCGPRPETDALFCSDCGRLLGGSDQCRRCHGVILAGSRFCESCGEKVAA